MIFVDQKNTAVDMKRFGGSSTELLAMDDKSLFFISWAVLLSWELNYFMHNAPGRGTETDIAVSFNLVDFFLHSLKVQKQIPI